MYNYVERNYLIDAHLVDHSFLKLEFLKGKQGSRNILTKMKAHVFRTSKIVAEFK